MLPFVTEAVERFREDLVRCASGALTRGGCRAAIGATDAALARQVAQTGGLPAARRAFLDAVEAYTGGGDATAALARAPQQDEAFLGGALAALRAFRAALEEARPAAP
ncbi:hypothetical protein Q8W71_09275 [Methylobacterium sp. NEAU 140]|uniref:hypothetical protein n=1 Tax=Methylobacterium sp. NEAU 140 TaxID=3064945 RepID=UPI00273698AC|nr:hypothetical protein [Methylobacterium sp. NEAU 140]MDP4022811.1 hypothetical protein [Methylobacterium sp. NEAU 140]